LLSGKNFVPRLFSDVGLSPSNSEFLLGQLIIQFSRTFAMEGKRAILAYHRGALMKILPCTENVSP
jgi:hypothetical protein